MFFLFEPFTDGKTKRTKANTIEREQTSWREALTRNGGCVFVFMPRANQLNHVEQNTLTQTQAKVMYTNEQIITLGAFLPYLPNDYIRRCITVQRNKHKQNQKKTKLTVDLIDEMVLLNPFLSYFIKLNFVVFPFKQRYIRKHN